MILLLILIIFSLTAFCQEDICKIDEKKSSIEFIVEITAILFGTAVVTLFSYGISRLQLIS